MKQKININVRRGGGGRSHTVGESLHYAYKVDIIDSYEYHILLDKVMRNHINGDSNLSREIYDIAKAYKDQHFKYDGGCMIKDAINSAINRKSRRR